MKTPSKGAFSMVEVLVAAVVFSIGAAGVLIAVSRSRSPVADSDRRVQAAVYGKQVLARLRAGVSANTWTGPDWTDGVHDVSSADFNAAYTVTTDASGGKKVDLTLSW
ncbi:MAG: prepilin-type N-terminal cleavage/methylation domain-containing protein [Candidatus Omnitrophica bacterium]|nr:prepilin-type N-terminal cleavage/methylation domain-containing protein [Candidatus Omnitrophota bacterium]